MPSTPQSSRGNTPRRLVSLSTTPVSPVLNNDVDLASLPPTISPCHHLWTSHLRIPPSQRHVSLCRPTFHHLSPLTFSLLRTPSQHLVSLCGPTLKHLSLLTFSSSQDSSISASRPPVNTRFLIAYMNLLLSCHLVTILKTANCIAPDCHKPPCIKCERMLCVVQLVHTEGYCCLPHAFSIVSPVTTYGPRISEFLHLSITFPFVAPHSSISAR